MLYATEEHTGTTPPGCGRSTSNRPTQDPEIPKGTKSWGAAMNKETLR